MYISLFSPEFHHIEALNAAHFPRMDLVFHELPPSSGEVFFAAGDDAWVGQYSDILSYFRFAPPAAVVISNFKLPDSWARAEYR